ncbi:MAG TPA: SHOCT domain-containing protein [Solirubrobacteraceae bacterium]|nr:SHOCT domain-containing protein [Solirubrobacteraceae bacterium]
MLVLGSYTFGDALLTVLEIALLFLWIWIAIGVIVDVFRSRDLSGWAKAAWLVLIVILPLVGVLIYLIARGHKMSEHAVTQAREQDAAFRSYVRSAAASPADDLAKLEDLHNRGVLSDEEFQRAKQKALG